MTFSKQNRNRNEVKFGFATVSNGNFSNLCGRYEIRGADKCNRNEKNTRLRLLKIESRRNDTTCFLEKG